MLVEEYLHTIFEGADCEYVDGKIVERNTGEFLHGIVHAKLGSLLVCLGTRAQLSISCRIRISASRYRIPDISQTSDVLRTENPAIEIALSEALSRLT